MTSFLSSEIILHVWAFSFIPYFEHDFSSFLVNSFSNTSEQWVFGHKFFKLKKIFFIILHSEDLPLLQWFVNFEKIINK